MAAWFSAVAGSGLIGCWRPGRRAAPKIRRSAARLATFGDRIATHSLRADASRLAVMVFGDAASSRDVDEAERVIVVYLHDRCLIEQVKLLDAAGEPEIAAFRVSLIQALAASAVGILLDRAGAPLAPSEPYPGPVQLLDDLWRRVATSANASPGAVGKPG